MFGMDMTKFPGWGPTPSALSTSGVEPSARWRARHVRLRNVPSVSLLQVLMACALTVTKHPWHR